MPLLHILSDLHCEFAPFKSDSGNADVIVLAGDINHALKGLDWARSSYPDTPIVYVAGNHEYYGEAIPHLTAKLRQRALQLDISFLENDGVELGGVRFLGCTLWTDLQLFGPDAPWVVDAVSTTMIDYRNIRVSPGFRRLRPADTIGWHRESVRWLRSALTAVGRPTVVVTHHAPSALSIDPRYREDPVSAAYASHLDDFVAQSGAQLWIHGHTHLSMDYSIGDTRVVSNQKGYEDEASESFDPALAIEIAV